MNNGIFAEDMSFSLSEQLKIYRNLKMLVYNNLIEIPDDEALTNELQYLKVVNGRIVHDVFGKDRSDAVAAASWAATGELLTERQRLIRETIGEHQASGSHYAIVQTSWH